MKQIITTLMLAALCTANIWAQDTLYVKPNSASTAWNDRTSVYTNLQDAIDAAVSGDQIWVAEGTYTPTATLSNGTDNRCKAFMLKSGISLYGGFAGTEASVTERDNEADLWDFATPTILSGDVAQTPDVNTDNSYHVIYGTDLQDIVIDGFIITGGYGNRTSYNEEQKGAGIFLGVSNHGCTNCEIRNCEIYDNMAQLNGGAAYLPKTCTLNGCYIHNNSTLAANSSGGGVYWENFSFPTDVAVECVFENNICPATQSYSPSSRYGGGAVSAGSNCQFYHCTFVNNSSTDPGGAAYANAGNQFKHCFFAGNQASEGGCIFGGSSASLLVSNCLFANNAATNNGGCISTTGSSCRSVNCTFVGNTAATNTVINAGSGFTLFNSILWNNGDNTDNFFNANLNCQNTAVEGLLASGNNNLNVDLAALHFVASSTLVGVPTNENEWEEILDADYSFTGQSVCKDAGSLATISLSGYQFPDEDLNGEARVNGSAIDLGCFETQCAEEAPILNFTFLDTTYMEDQPGMGFITVLASIENCNEDYTYSINHDVTSMMNYFENCEYTFELFFPCNNPIRVSQVDGNECARITDTTIVIDSLFNTVGIAENEVPMLEIFPNPTSDFCTIHHTMNLSQDTQVEIYDVNGKLVAVQNVAENDTKINLTNCKSGVYIIKLVNNGQLVATSRIIKK